MYLYCTPTYTHTWCISNICTIEIHPVLIHTCILGNTTCVYMWVYSSVCTHTYTHTWCISNICTVDIHPVLIHTYILGNTTYVVHRGCTVVCVDPYINTHVVSPIATNNTCSAMHTIPHICLYIHLFNFKSQSRI